MLLIDLSGVVIGSCIEFLSREKDGVSDGLIRHVTLSQILFYKKKFKEYGEIVIAADGKNYWRKEVFPYYKMNRKKVRKDSTIDWESFFYHFGTVKNELRDILPYTFVEVERCEADDVIAVLTKRYSRSEKIMIVSSDKDMIQLQKKGYSVKQYSPTIKKFLTEKENDYSLIEHCIRGDASDGIPNIMSEDDVFLCDDKRQKRISKQMIADAAQMKNPELICPNADALDRFKRNRTLVDVDYIPDIYCNAIVNEYEVQTKRDGGNIMKYLIEHKMKNLLDKLGEF